MKTSQLFKLIFGIVINYCILGAIIFIVFTKLNFSLEDTIFAVGSTALFIGICFNILGNPMNLSMDSPENLNSQYVQRVYLKAQKNKSAKKKITFSIASIISGAIILSSIFILITGYFL
jgi:hypothetical protein